MCKRNNEVMNTKEKNKENSGTEKAPGLVYWLCLRWRIWLQCCNLPAPSTGCIRTYRTGANGVCRSVYRKFLGILQEAWKRGANPSQFRWMSNHSSGQALSSEILFTVVFTSDQLKRRHKPGSPPPAKPLEEICCGITFSTVRIFVMPLWDSICFAI